MSHSFHERGSPWFRKQAYRNPQTEIRSKMVRGARMSGIVISGLGYFLTRTARLNLEQ